MEKERAYKRIEERVKLHTVIFRFLLNALLLTFVGTVTLWVNATLPQSGSFIILGLFTSLVLMILCVSMYIVINNDINLY